MRASDPTGLHRVLDDCTGPRRWRPAPGRPAARHPHASCGPTRCASASSGSTSTPRRSASSSASTTRTTATRSAREVLDIVADPRQDAEPRDRLRRHARRHRRGGRPRVAARPRGRRPRRDAGLPDPDPARHRGRPRALGRRGPSRCPADGYAVLFGRSIAAVIPDDLAQRAQPGRDGRLRRAGADQARRRASTTQPVVAVIGGAGKSGSLSLAAARDAGAAAHRRRRAAPRRSASCSRTPAWPTRSSSPTPATRSPCATRSPPTGGPADVTVVCVDVPGCEGGAILATAERGTVIFFSMATSFSRRRAGRRGPGRRRADARRQRLRPRPRGVRPGAAARRRRRPRTLRAEAVMATTEPRSGQLGLDKADVRRARTLARQVGRPIVKLAQQHTTVSVERATLRMAGLAGADPDGTPWVNRLLDVRPRRRRPRARRRAAGVGRPAPRRGRRPAHPGPEGQPPARSPSELPEGKDATARRAAAARRPSAPASSGSTPTASERERMIEQDRRRPAQAVDLPDRRHRRHLRGHPAGAGRRPRGRRRHRGDPVDRAEPARLRARGRDPRGLRRHLRHPGELPPDAGGPRRDVAGSSAATSG